MFIKVTKTNDFPFYINENEIRMFYKTENGSHIVLQNEHLTVKETPTEIADMLRGITINKR